LLAFLVGFAAPTAGLAQVRAQTPSLIALPRSETVYMGGAVWGPITSLNPFSPSNSQLDDYLQSMVYRPCSSSRLSRAAFTLPWERTSP